MRTNDAGVELIKREEGLRLTAYRCPSGVWTIGWGHTGGVRQGDRVTLERAQELFDADLERSERDVTELAGSAGLNANQFSALVSFDFNLGRAQFEASTLRRLLLKGDFERAAAEFSRWVHGAGGQVLPGLERRRAAEQALFCRPAGVT